ncbi:MAG: Exodeoxyribonuclease 7 small subunit [Chlamydiia bacterium]|nr:Exodeoxyribonuclease 7 small subunit [Chlamydiia bacterium]
MTKKSPISFEKAYHRLEEILERMNSGNVPLEESLSLYQEADQLINQCSQELNQAEAKIQMLIKNRDGSLQLDPNQNPQMTQVEGNRQQMLTRNHQAELNDN